MAYSNESLLSTAIERLNDKMDKIDEKVDSVQSDVNKFVILFEKLAHIEKIYDDSNKRVHQRIDEIEKRIEKTEERQNNSGCPTLKSFQSGYDNELKHNLNKIDDHEKRIKAIEIIPSTRLSNNPKHYLYLWGTFFLLMLVARDSFSTLLTNIPWFEQDKRMSEYLNMSYKGMEQMFSNIGFRWDFIIYSLIPIIAGVKYIYTYCYEDKLFIRLFNTYIASNAFWLLTIHVPYNNRFAYLSWFLYPIVLIYPLLKDNLINNQGERIKWIILCYYMFTYVMWIK